MKIISSIILASTLLLTPALMAKGSGNGSNNANFAQKKQKAINKLDQKISVLEDLRRCVKASKNKDNLKTCRANAKKTNKKLKKQKKAEKKKRKQENKNKNN